MKKKTYYLRFGLLGMILCILSCEKDPPVNLAPTCNIVAPDDSTVIPVGDTLTVVAEASDPDGDINTVLFYVNGEGVYSTSTYPYQYKYVPSPDQVGYITIKATALDLEGEPASDDIYIHVTFNLPSVLTLEISADSNNIITGGGNILDDGGSPVTRRGLCWSTEPKPTLDDNHTTDGTGTGAYTSSIAGLTPGKTYYIRAYATNSEGTSYGNEIIYVFVGPPVVQTEGITEITNITAIYTGNLVSDGGAPVSAMGFCWSTSPDPIASDNFILVEHGTGSFECDITGLKANTTYYARAFATNSKGTSYGEETEFTTLPLEYDMIEDERDGQTYWTVKIGNQWWMAENLNAGILTESIADSTGHSDVSDNGIIEKYCYENNPEYCELYGGLYDWNEMMQYNFSDWGQIGTTQGVCPAGWHLPTDNEWKTLEINLGMSPGEADKVDFRGTNEADKLKETGYNHWYPNAGATDEVGFTALPAGIRLIDGEFDANILVTTFWTSTGIDSGGSWYRHLVAEDPRILRGVGANDEGFSVRCVKDVQ
jgi:uncharacterized protein (TIGR02145 family)